MWWCIGVGMIMWWHIIIGVVARKRSYLPYIQRALTSDVVAKYFAHLLEESSRVERLGGAMFLTFSPICSTPLAYACICRYDLPGIGGLNFVLTQSLGGGGVSSLRIDPQVRPLQIDFLFPVHRPRPHSCTAYSSIICAATEPHCNNLGGV